MTEEQRKKTLAEEVRELFDKSGLKVDDLASALGINRTVVFDYRKVGPTTTGKAKLAKFAYNLGDDRAAAVFLGAFLDDVPDLRDLVAPRIHPSTEKGNTGTRTPAPVSGIELKWRSRLSRKIDEIIALNEDYFCERAEQGLDFILDTSKAVRWARDKK